MDHDTTKTFLDTLAGLVAGATILKLLPAIAALLTIIWTGIRIYEWWRTSRIID